MNCELALKCLQINKHSKHFQPRLYLSDELPNELLPERIYLIYSSTSVAANDSIYGHMYSIDTISDESLQTSITFFDSYGRFGNHFPNAPIQRSIHVYKKLFGANCHINRIKYQSKNFRVCAYLTIMFLLRRSQRISLGEINQKGLVFAESVSRLCELISRAAKPSPYRIDLPGVMNAEFDVTSPFENLRDDSEQPGFSKLKPVDLSSPGEHEKKAIKSCKKKTTIKKPCQSAESKKKEKKKKPQGEPQNAISPASTPSGKCDPIPIPRGKKRYIKPTSATVMKRRSVEPIWMNSNCILAIDNGFKSLHSYMEMCKQEFGRPPRWKEFESEMELK